MTKPNEENVQNVFKEAAPSITNHSLHKYDTIIILELQIIKFMSKDFFIHITGENFDDPFCLAIKRQLVDEIVLRSITSNDLLGTQKKIYITTVFFFSLSKNKFL